MTRKSLFLALAAPFCWGTSFSLAKPTLMHFPPLLMMLFAYGFIAAVTFFTVRGRPKTPWKHSLIIATLGVTVQGALLFWGVQGVSATTSNLLLQTQVPAAVLMGWLVIGEQLTARKLIGTAIALVGVATVIGLPEKRPPLAPVMMIIVSGFIWALAQVLVRKWSKDSGAMALRNNARYGLPQLMLATLLLEQGQWQSIVTATPVQWGLLAFVAIIGFYVAYAAWFNLLRYVQMDEAAPYILLMTPIGLATAVIFLGEKMTSIQVIGAILLMVGLAIVNGLGMRRIATT